MKLTLGPAQRSTIGLHNFFPFGSLVYAENTEKYRNYCNCYLGFRRVAAAASVAASASAGRKFLPSQQK